MNQTLTVFTTITASYADSDELQLCLKMFSDALPPANWVIHTPDMLVTAQALFQQNKPTEGYVLFVKEPALLIDKQTYPLLEKHLINDSNVIVVLPSDTRNINNKVAANYYTLRGFERYSGDCCIQSDANLPYDGREPWLFLISAKNLKHLTLPENPFSLPAQLTREQVVIAMNAYSHPFFNYYNESRVDLLPFVPNSTQSLLDIGCSRGGFAEAVKTKLHCRVSGIELNRHEAQSAEKVLDRLWVGDVLSLEIQEQFDCISCLDVLEHFANPQQLLKIIRHWLTPNGRILLNVPNVGFWAIVEDLLAGRWDYVPVGILCNTHMRFYTQYSLRQLLQECGFNIITLESHRIPLPEHIEIGFNDYQKTGLRVDFDNLSTLAFTVLAEPIE